MKNVVLWIPQGRLGNQIFQYQAIIHLMPQFKVLTINNGFFDLFKNNNNFYILKIKIRGFVIDNATKFFRFLSKKGIVGQVHPLHGLQRGYDIELKELTCCPGLFKNIWYVEGWFQSPEFMNPKPKIKQEILSMRANFINSFPKRSTLVAVHIRFGDFKDWTILGIKNVTLPQSYYIKAFEKFSKLLDSPIFIIFSDEIATARKFLKNLPYKFQFSSLTSDIEDFAYITFCSHGISSASTFSWWAMSLIKNPNKIIIAPKYWQGFKSREWYPPDIIRKDFSYLEVYK